MLILSRKRLLRQHSVYQVAAPVMIDVFGCWLNHQGTSPVHVTKDTGKLVLKKVNSTLLSDWPIFWGSFWLQLAFRPVDWTKQAVREAATTRPRPLQVDLSPFWFYACKIWFHVVVIVCLGLAAYSFIFLNHFFTFLYFFVLTVFFLLFYVDQFNGLLWPFW